MYNEMLEFLSQTTLEITLFEVRGNANFKWHSTNNVDDFLKLLRIYDEMYKDVYEIPIAKVSINYEYFGNTLVVDYLN